jgi:hypothetical protein
MNSVEVFENVLQILDQERNANAGDALTAALLERIKNRIRNEVHPRPFVPPTPAPAKPPSPCAPYLDENGRPIFHGGGRP